MSCGIGRRLGSDPTLLWLWCRVAVTALIRLLAWEPPYASGAALKRQKINKNLKNKNKKKSLPGPQPRPIKSDSLGWDSGTNSFGMLLGDSNVTDKWHSDHSFDAGVSCLGSNYTYALSWKLTLGS